MNEEPPDNDFSVRARSGRERQDFRKDEKTGTWRAVYRYTDWNGEKKQTQKRGLKTKREAQSWEREQLIKSSTDLDMTFKSFVKLIPHWLHAALWDCTKKALDSKQKTRPRRPACLSLLPHLFPFYDPCHARRGGHRRESGGRTAGNPNFPAFAKLSFSQIHTIKRTRLCYR